MARPINAPTANDSLRAIARKRAGMSLNAAGVLSHTSTATAKMYELDRMAVSEASRAKLDEFYAALMGEGSKP